MRHFVTALIVGVSLFLPRIGQVAQPAAITDVQAKLVIIHSFLGEYAAWPGKFALDERSEVTLCSTGHDDVVRDLPMMESASTSDLRVLVLQLSSFKQLSQCHMLYIADDRAVQTASILDKARHYPILTVSAVPNFVDAGGMVGLVSEVKYQGTFEKHYVRYSLNLRATEHAGISIHPDALELARRVVRP